MKTIETDLSAELRLRIRAVAKKRHISETNVLRLCYAEGVSEAVEIGRIWVNEVEKKGLKDEMETLSTQIAEKNIRLMDISAKCASDNFECFEQFNRVTKNLISYVGKRAEAKRLVALLKDKGVHFDAGPGEIPNIDNLTRRYLFKE